MRKSFLMRLLVIALLSSAARAQIVQNHDVFFSAGPAWNQPQVIGGTNVMLVGSTGFSYQLDYGYQVARASAASLMLDLSFLYAHLGALRPNVPANVPASGSSSFNAETAGLRFIVPVHSRLSFYGVSGGGWGLFSSPAVIGGASSAVGPHSTIHGVFAFGGGVDVRLSQRISLRAEVRDLVTGKELSGSIGRQHVLPLFGVGFHF